MSKNHDIVEFSKELMRETDKAYCFDSGKIDENKNPIGIWVPKSQCEYDKNDLCLQMPEWLAMDKGFI